MRVNHALLMDEARIICMQINIFIRVKAFYLEIDCTIVARAEIAMDCSQYLFQDLSWLIVFEEYSIGLDPHIIPILNIVFESKNLHQKRWNLFFITLMFSIDFAEGIMEGVDVKKELKD